MALNPNSFVDVVMDGFSLHIEPPSYTIAEWKYTDLFCVVPISRKLKHCIVNLQTALKFL